MGKLLLGLYAVGYRGGYLAGAILVDDGLPVCEELDIDQINVRGGLQGVALLLVKGTCHAHL